MRGDLAVALMCAFGLGVAVALEAVDRRDQEKAKQTAELVRKCVYYVVLDKDGKPQCRPMMPRLDIMMPYRGEPLKLKRREIKQAIHSEPKGKS